MTREKDRENEKDNPATEPDRENGQGRHDGKPHDPKEFDVMNPAVPENKIQRSK